MYDRVFLGLLSLSLVCLQLLWFDFCFFWLLVGGFSCLIGEADWLLVLMGSGFAELGSGAMLPSAC